MSQARVLICDDQELMRSALRMIVNSQDDLELVGEAADGAQAVRLAAEHRPDLVLMDVRMPVLDGVEATRRVCEVSPNTKVLVITTFDLDEYVEQALRHGASGFLLKDATSEEMLVAIRAVLRGDAAMAPAVVRRLVERHLSTPVAPPPDPRLHRLTDREREVFGLLAKGASNAEIADQLFLGETTVKTHVSRVLSKLDLRDRVHAVVHAYESGFVRPGE
ncbi:response regulator transcription factor [Lentzea cavernae]|uniref:DNA-binding response regulator n=1 Tax=Lentzea cavernae TaxID=2020703 RepID=A0ABQ3MHC9_9PSEU|nr:response regulator transcription factor [Lentzea cavernae]GHH43764.1 DNA-binding response regulator [Lentzea cavernae]